MNSFSASILQSSMLSVTQAIDFLYEHFDASLSAVHRLKMYTMSRSPFT
jgi:hypothetical protein